jgi:hypothetical protein
MSIVPKEVVVDAPAAWNAQADEFNQWDALGEDEKLEWTANRAAQWALEQALGKLADEYVDAEATLAPEDRAYNAAVGHCEDAIRALMNGGESDGQG